MDAYLQELLPKMLLQLKETRTGSPGFLGENYTDSNGILQNDTCHEEWDKILNRMIFLWKESNERTCSKKNPYAKKHTQAYKQFSKNLWISRRKA
ncbi:hypothetical protein P261_02361 [Lachnospiraceae bacterium TWA4]|nr:hypothetical protein P261_02361 [Lachnospiraceae bacterium TWA4]